MFRRSSGWMHRSTGDAIIGKALDAYYSGVVVARQAASIAEVSTLLTCLRLNKGADKKKITAASLIASTSFHPSTIREASSDSNLLPESKVHHPTCPFLVDRVPLYALHEHQGFLKTPCPACATKRLHFLASEDFCTDMAKRSVRLPSRMQAPSPLMHQPPPSMEAAIAASFQSVDGFVAALTDHCTSRRGSGFTWIAWCNTTQKMVVVNMPRNAAPTTIGLWPLAAFNLTETVIGDVFHAVQADAITAPNAATIVHPEWSRAARNPSAAATREATADTESSMSLQGMVLRLAQYYVAHLDWAAVEGALDAARAYYASPKRAEKQKIHEDSLAEIAKKRALSAWREAHDEVVDAAPSTSAVAGASKPVPNVPTGSDAPQPAMSGEDAYVEGDGTARSQEAPSVKEEDVAETAAASSEATATSSEEAAAEYTVSDDGVQTFTYSDGRRTVVDPAAGTTTFYSEERVTTTYADGCSHFAFADGRVLWTDKQGEVYSTRPPASPDA